LSHDFVIMRNLLASFLLLAAGTTFAAEPPRVFHASDSPLTITSFKVDFAGDAPVAKMWVRNHTAEVVEDSIFELFAFTPDGEIEAVYSFSANFPIPAGGEVLLVRRGELLDFTREVSIVATPSLALFADRCWELPQDAGVIVRDSIQRARPK
jgi:hypothetical protein